MKSLTVLRTGAGSLPSPPVIEGLRALGCRVVAADADPLSVGFTCADASAVIPRADAPDFGDAILELCKNEKIDAILPAVNEEITRLCALRGKLADIGVTLVAPSATTVETCLDKIQTAAALERAGLATPRTATAQDARTAGWSYPVIIEPRRGRGSRGVVRAADLVELEYTLDRAPEDVVVQECNTAPEYTIDLFASASSELRMASVRRRLKVNAGISVAGEIVDPAPYLSDLETLVRELSLAGPSCVQCFHDGDGPPVFFDLNPRLGGGVALTLRGGTPILAGILASLRGEDVSRVVGAGVGLRFLRKYEEVYLDEDRLHS